MDLKLHTYLLILCFNSSNRDGLPTCSERYNKKLNMHSNNFWSFFNSNCKILFFKSVWQDVSVRKIDVLPHEFSFVIRALYNIISTVSSVGSPKELIFFSAI